MHARQESVLTVNKKGPCAVYASDIVLDHDVEVVNPEHFIARLTKEGELNMAMKVELGRGYQPAAVRVSEEGDRPISKLFVDASSVRFAGYPMWLKQQGSNSVRTSTS